MSRIVFGIVLGIVFGLSMSSGVSVAGAKRGKAPKATTRPSPASHLEIDLVVMSRDARTDELHLLVASSRAFARLKLLRLESDGLLAQIGGGPGLPLSSALTAGGGAGHGQVGVVGSVSIPPAPPRPDEPAALTSPGQAAGWRAFDAMQLWLLLRPGVSDFALAATIDLETQSGYRGRACDACVLAQRAGVVVIARGLDPGVVDGITAEVVTGRRDLGATLLSLAQGLRRRWPGRAVVRSAAYYRMPTQGRGREELIVDVHSGGRANEQLGRLHAWHQGEVAGPEALVEARHAQARGAHKSARRWAGRASEAMRGALHAYDKVPLWHARQALALALVDPKDDRAVRALDKALILAPRAREVRMIAAEVLALRGDRAGARRQIAAVLKASPDDRGALMALESLGTPAQ